MFPENNLEDGLGRLWFDENGVGYHAPFGANDKPPTSCGWDANTHPLHQQLYHVGTYVTETLAAVPVCPNAMGHEGPQRSLSSQPDVRPFLFQHGCNVHGVPRRENFQTAPGKMAFPDYGTFEGAHLPNRDEASIAPANSADGPLAGSASSFSPRNSFHQSHQNVPPGPRSDAAYPDSGHWQPHPLSAAFFGLDTSGPNSRTSLNAPAHVSQFSLQGPVFGVESMEVGETLPVDEASFRLQYPFHAGAFCPRYCEPGGLKCQCHHPSQGINGLEQFNDGIYCIPFKGLSSDWGRRTID